MMTKRGGLHSGHPRVVVEDDGEGQAHGDSLYTMAPMFTADNLVSFQQL